MLKQLRISRYNSRMPRGTREQKFKSPSIRDISLNLRETLIVVIVRARTGNIQLLRSSSNRVQLEKKTCCRRDIYFYGTNTSTTQWSHGESTRIMFSFYHALIVNWLLADMIGMTMRRGFSVRFVCWLCSLTLLYARVKLHNPPLSKHLRGGGLKGKTRTSIG